MFDDGSAIAVAVKAGNINISTEYMSIEDHLDKEKQATLDELERRKRARMMKVSTDDAEVKKDLRTLGEPICYFGEGPADRRERLKQLLSRLGPDVLRRDVFEVQEKPQDKYQETTWYHEGPASLRVARQWIAEYSIPRARARLEEARQRRAIPDKVKVAGRQDTQKRLQKIANQCSQIGDARPLTFVQFSPNSQMLATASRGGLIKLWTVPDCQPIRTLKGHQGPVGAVVFHPHATTPQMEDEACCLASCGQDGSVKLWSLTSDEPKADVPGHSHRVSRLAYHPSGRFLGTCCHDCSWRLWDLEQAEEVLHQEGHSKGVHCIAFQQDGSLALTGGLDAFARLWDLRTGKCVMFMEGHLKAIYGVDFAPNGFQAITGSEDHSCKIWDIRQRLSIYTIPAHTSLVSTCKFQPGDGHYIVSSSYDKTAKVWLSATWQPLKTLSGHDERVSSVDISPDSQYIATSSFDRTFKLWAPEF